jgi:hypothetical protein
MDADPLGTSVGKPTTTLGVWITKMIQTIAMAMGDSRK